MMIVSNIYYKETVSSPIDKVYSDTEGLRLYLVQLAKDKLILLN